MITYNEYIKAHKELELKSYKVLTDEERADIALQQHELAMAYSAEYMKRMYRYRTRKVALFNIGAKP